MKMTTILLVISLVTHTVMAGPLTKKEEKEKRALDKLPKSLFLIKRAKINADVSGPQFYPAEAQLRTIINDSKIHNYKKFE